MSESVEDKVIYFTEALCDLMDAHEALVSARAKHDEKQATAWFECRWNAAERVGYTLIRLLKEKSR